MVPEPWSTVHDPMPDGDWRRHLGVVQKPKDSNDRFPLTRKGRGLGQQRFIARNPCGEFALLIADRFGFSGKQKFNPRSFDAIHCEFERGRAAVQREDSQFWFSTSHLAPGGKIELIGSNANRGPPACRHHARRRRVCGAPSWSNSARSPSAPDRRAAEYAGWRQRQVGSGRDC
jgi:hypothetical protein